MIGDIKMNLEEFKKDLGDLINRHSMENGSDTPDFVLAEYLINCLLSFNQSVNHRERLKG